MYDFASSDGENYSLSKRYLYGAEVDQILAQENVDDALITDPYRVYWMLADNQGTIRDVVDHDGTRVEHYKYSAYGKLLDGVQTLTRYLYTGRELDPSAGLQYNRARWYDSASGRWLSEGPLSFAGGDTNLYRYVGNSPTNGTDPTGLAGERPNQINGHGIHWLNEGWTGAQPQRDGRKIGYYTTSRWYQLWGREGHVVESTGDLPHDSWAREEAGIMLVERSVSYGSSSLFA